VHYGGVPESEPPSLEHEENLVAALREPDRISEIWLTITGSLSDRLAIEMQKAMPWLETLRLISQDMHEPLLPDKFLGGSAPRLSAISLHGVAFPAFPKLLLSTSGLTTLELCHIPISGYFSPEVLVVGLSAMTQLKSLTINFDFWMSHFHVNNLYTHPRGHTVLPALTNFKFSGDNEYLEAIVSRVDTPLLELADLRFFNRFAFEIPHLSHFIRRTSQLALPTHVKIAMSGCGFSIALVHQTGTPHNSPVQLFLQITCRHFHSQLTTIPPISAQLSPFFPGVGLLELYAFPPVASGPNALDLVQWVELLRPFSNVEMLCVSGELVLDIARVLQWIISEQDPGLFPALREVSLGNSQELTAALDAIAPFIGARRLSGGRSVVVSNWDTSTFN
jgi:hypothetical protein